MADAHHIFGGDLVLAATGDLATVTGIPLSQQRVLRRLLTNPGDYLWAPDYGAGLPAFIGETVNPSRVAAVILAQLMLEPAVSRTPPPQAIVTAIPDGMFVQIRYTESGTGQPSLLSFSVTP